MTTSQPNNLIGIAFILLTCLTMTLSASIIRMVGKDLGAFEVVLIRCSFSLLYILILHGRTGRALYTAPRPLLLTFRSLTLSILVLGNFYAIVHLPLVQVTALQYTKPLFLVILAALFLSERVRLPRTIATVAGFLGVLVILRPDSGFHPVQVIALIAALGMATIAVITKKMTRDHSTNTMVFYGNLFIVLACLGPAIANWQTPDLFQLAMIAALGLTAYAGQTFMVQAYRYGEATAVTPFEYVRIIFVAIAGYIAFGEIPDRWTVIGVIIIVAATLFIALREARKKRQAAKV